MKRQGCQIEWEPTAARAELERRGTDFMHSGVVESIRKNKVALKGPLATAVANGRPEHQRGRCGKRSISMPICGR